MSLELGDDLLRGGAARVVAHDEIGALAPEGERDRAAEATTRSGHQRYASVQSSHVPGDGSIRVMHDPRDVLTSARLELAALRVRRAASLGSLVAIAPARFAAAVAHARIGQLSGLDLLAAWVAHDRLHLTQLGAALARAWATRWAPLRTEYAGPIPYASS